ncbi:MAG: DIP1984 family protein, partial [Ktedonobacterales bacterium]
ILPQSITLTEALARRDVLDIHRSILKTIADTASERLERYSLREIRRVTTVDVGALRRQIDDLARQRRELDTAIQAANWTTELIE